MKLQRRKSKGVGCREKIQKKTDSLNVHPLGATLSLLAVIYCEASLRLV
jgi:hypothetical protein